MRKFSCRVGCAILLLALVLQIAGHSAELLRLTNGEMIALISIGLAFMLPGIVHHVRQFLSSGER